MELEHVEGGRHRRCRCHRDRRRAAGPQWQAELSSPRAKGRPCQVVRSWGRGGVTRSGIAPTGSAGCARPYASRRPERPCTRRTRHLLGPQRTAGAGGAGIRWQLRFRGRVAAGRDSSRTRAVLDGLGLGLIAPLSGPAGCDGGLGWRRRPAGGGMAGHVLGRAGDGHHGGCGGVVRRGRLTAWRIKNRPRTPPARCEAPRQSLTTQRGPDAVDSSALGTA